MQEGYLPAVSRTTDSRGLCLTLVNGTGVVATLRRDPSSDAAAPLGSKDRKKKKLENDFY